MLAPELQRAHQGALALARASKSPKVRTTSSGPREVGAMAKGLGSIPKEGALGPGKYSKLSI